MSSIQVGVRSRPWTLDDRLGIDMQQVSADSGTITLLNSDYSTKFFSFSYSWWTAFNWKHHCDKKDHDYCEGMKVISQDDVYASIGAKVKKDLYEGNAVVLFAYGLSGSGKTYTVFGMDDVKNKSSWFYHATPDSNWGVLPRLGYDVFQDKKDGWKVTMKYFQNVVDIVRDLMSPQGTEKVYKEGMRKDKDGFMDIEWCASAVVNSWDEFRKTFLTANARKAIAPTQFNHQSTRGHCIMTIEVMMPDEEDPNMKKRGRVYVCDLAGTEPAGDIYYALYENKKMEDGSVEVKLIGPHKNQAKTAELQNQGKKINLSLSEMAQFFMKMAEAFKAKKLKPGVSIPGCNTYFLCKYLKDTMLNAKTYLFCAIRPECTYLKYTFATLGFAKNASVIKLSPKKATTAKSPAERKLMQELDKYKQMVEELKKSGGGGGGGGDSDEVAKLQAMLAAQQEQLQKVVNEDGGDDGGASAALAAEQEKKVAQYAQRGITLVETVDLEAYGEPYLVNLDEDQFRSKRFLYALKDGETSFGPDGDIRPPSFSVKKGHCKIAVAAGAASVVGGAGDTWAAGRRVPAGESVSLKCGDWVLMGKEAMLYVAPGEPLPEEDLEAIFDAIDGATRSAPSTPGGGDSDELAKRIRELEAQNSELQASTDGKAAGGGGGEGGESPRVKASFDETEVMNVINMIKEVQEVCKAFDREMLEFEPVLARQDRAEGGQGKTFIKVTHTKTKQVSYLSDADFKYKGTILMDEKLQMVMSFESGADYAVSDAHDPVALFFEDTFHIASGRHFCEYLVYCFETEPEDRDVQLVSSASPYHNSGILNIEWAPEGDAPEIDDPSQLLGKAWTFKLKITNAAIKIRARSCYVSYYFPDESGDMVRHVTDVCDVATMTPTFDYEAIHRIPNVTQPFLDFISGKNGMDFDVYASPTYTIPQNKIATTNAVCAASFGADVVKSGVEVEIDALKADKTHLATALDAAIAEIAKASGEEPSKVKTRLLAAQLQDAAVN